MQRSPPRRRDSVMDAPHDPLLTTPPMEPSRINQHQAAGAGPQRGPDAADAVGAVHGCRLPPFWRGNPELWFLQVEAAFHALRVRGDETKYSLAVSLLDPDSLQELADVVRSPPAERKYEHLKAVILQRFSDSADQQLLRLLTQLELGDRKPSQLLRQMRALAGDRVADDVIRVRWLDLLPISIRRILKVLKFGPLEDLAPAADELMEGGPSVMAASVPTIRSACDTCASSHAPSVSTTAHVATELAAIRAMMAQMVSLQREVLERLDAPATGGRSRYFRRGRSASRPRAAASGGQAGFCSYHRRWGANAQRCLQPCSFRASALSSPSAGN